jgi:hypothetical protein
MPVLLGEAGVCHPAAQRRLTGKWPVFAGCSMAINDFGQECESSGRSVRSFAGCDVAPIACTRLPISINWQIGVIGIVVAIVQLF